MQFKRLPMDQKQNLFSAVSFFIIALETIIFGLIMYYGSVFPYLDIDAEQVDFAAIMLAVIAGGAGWVYCYVRKILGEFRIYLELPQPQAVSSSPVATPLLPICSGAFILNCAVFDNDSALATLRFAAQGCACLLVVLVNGLLQEMQSKP